MPYAHSPKLLAWLDAGYLPYVVLKPATIEQRRVTVRRFSAFLGRPATIDDLAREVLVRFVDWYARQPNVEPATVAAKRSHLLTLWRFALEETLTTEELRRIKVVPQPEKVPEGDDEEELRRLLEALRKLPGRVGHQKTGVPRGVIYPATALVLLSTGLRPGAAMQIRKSDVRRDGTFTVRWRTQKTASEQTKRLNAAALAACREIERYVKSPYLLPFSRSRSSVKRIGQWWKQARREAGLPAERQNLLQQMRRSAASHKERQQPGSATYFLGHKTPTLAKKSYLVPRIVCPEVIDGPELRLS